MRTIDWVDGGIELIDQTLLPAELRVCRVTSVGELVEDIRRLAVRGAPALGVAGAMGVALSASQGKAPEAVRAEAAALRRARPTAVNLSWGVDRALSVLGQGAAAVLAEALAVRDEDVAACVSMGQYGAEYVRGLVARDRARVMTICNTGGLATVERGTALGVIQTIFEQGWLAEALPLETRPLLQGARLTTWELQQMGAPYRLLVDSAGPALLAGGAADVVFVGADRIAANGDTANKIGSLSLALAAKYAGVPFVVVAPESTIDMNTPDGSVIVVEDRAAEEVTSIRGVPIAAPGSAAANPAFDVTPHGLITAIVTDRRVISPGLGQTPADVPLGPSRPGPA